MSDEALSETFAATVHETGSGPASFEAAVSRYLAAEKQDGRVDADVDEDALGFLIAGAVHNLIMSRPAYPRPTRRRLKRHLTAIADRLRPD